MMLIVHGLPKITKFFELKALLTQECNLSDFILDAFVTEEGGFTKQVKVGVATEDQGDNVFRVLDGYSFNGHILSVRGIGKDFHKTVKDTAEFGNHDVYDNSHSQPNPAYSQNVPQYSPMEVHKPQQRSYQDRDAHVWDHENNSNQGYNHGYSQNNPGIQHSGSPNITIPTHGHGQFSGPSYQQEHMPQNVQPAYQPTQQGNQWSAPNNQARNMGPVPPMNDPNYQHNMGVAAPTPDNFDIPTRAYTNPSHSNQQMRQEPVLRDIKRASPDRRWDSERGPHADGRISSQGRGGSQKGDFYRREESPSRGDFRRRDVSPRNRDMRKLSPQRKPSPKYPPRFSPTQDILKKNMEIQNRSMDKPFRRPAYEPNVNEVSNERPYGQQGKESWKVLQKDSMQEPEESRRPPDTWNQKALDPWGKKSSKKTQADDSWKQKPVQDRHEKERWSPKPQESWAQKKNSPPKEDWGKTPITIRSNKNRWNEGSHNDQEAKKSWEHSSKNVPRNLKSNEHPLKDSWSENNPRDRHENVSWECRPFEKQSNDSWKRERNETDRHSFESGREPPKFSKPNIPQVPIHASRRLGRSRSPKEESSPKRSWAQERSRHSSPGAAKVAPPPPSWPGHHGEEEHYSKSRPKSPVWEIRNSDELKRKLDHFDIVGRSGSHDFDRPDWISRDGKKCSSSMAAHDENREAYRDSNLPSRDEFIRRSEHSDQRQRRDEPDRHGYSHTPDAREREDRKRKASPHLRKADEAPRSLVQYHKEIRIRAINNIMEKILQRKYVNTNDFETKRLGLELRLAISVILKDIITDRETTLKNILDKYRSKFSEKDEDELFTEVISSFSQEFITKTLERGKKVSQRFDAPMKRHPEVAKVNYDKNVFTKTSEQGTKYYGALKTLDIKKKIGPDTSKTLSTGVIRQNPPAGINRNPPSGPKVSAPPQLSKPSQPTAALAKRKHIAETPVLPSKKKRQAMAKKIAETTNEAAPPQYKLSPLLQGCLNKEMKIMLEKIIAAVPEITDKMPKEDKIVIDILKNKGAQTLTDVLALNVKKRILNVHNPLYAKLQFFKQPPKETIRAIRNTFKLPAMSKVSPKVFAVQFTTLDDFDNFCNMKNIQFEGFNIKINAVYGFTICPPELQSAPIKKKNKGANTTIGIENDNRLQANSNIKASPGTATPKTENKPATTAVKQPAKITPNAKPTPQTPAKLNQQQINVVKKATDAVKAKPITASVLTTPTKNTQDKPPIVKNQQLVTKNNVKDDNKAKVTNVNAGHDKKEDHVATADIESILDDVIVLDEC